jgi:hypothetical protein
MMDWTKCSRNAATCWIEDQANLELAIGQQEQRPITLSLGWHPRIKCSSIQTLGETAEEPGRVQTVPKAIDRPYLDCLLLFVKSQTLAPDMW